MWREWEEEGEDDGSKSRIIVPVAGEPDELAVDVGYVDDVDDAPAPFKFFWKKSAAIESSLAESVESWWPITVYKLSWCV